ncbi:hypothetical protein ACFRAE_17130 [Sphingobacterium sp. HJSM2_6]|uniref:hypothetical protein n=1 Tax=Sphingobacterium sp. HJSM2_6 TaxID=3366264 RepID=UPI003BC15882
MSRDFCIRALQKTEGYIIHWELCDSMKGDDVKRTVDTAIPKGKLKSKVKPKL